MSAPIKQEDGTFRIEGLCGFYDGQVIGNQFKTKKEFVWKECGKIRRYQNPLFGVDKLEVVESRKDKQVISADNEGFNLLCYQSYTIVKPIF